MSALGRKQTFAADVRNGWEADVAVYVRADAKVSCWTPRPALMNVAGSGLKIECREHHVGSPHDSTLTRPKGELDGIRLMLGL